MFFFVQLGPHRVTLKKREYRTPSNPKAVCVCVQSLAITQLKTWFVLGSPRSLLFFDPAQCQGHYGSNKNVVRAITREGRGILSPNLVCGLVLGSPRCWLFLHHLGQISRFRLACGAFVFTNHNFACFRWEGITFGTIQPTLPLWGTLIWTSRQESWPWWWVRLGLGSRPCCRPFSGKWPPCRAECSGMSELLIVGLVHFERFTVQWIGVQSLTARCKYWQLCFQSQRRNWALAL